ncbi:MAG: LysM peptidoglycan-binding domain-containing protein [Ignavibacteriales bacterium]|jgi:nucleoid-associated protein YgaU|nr:LysM peptidoglycan-binding domain-containing protein [Ignavibacteriales bacterium]
MKFRNFLLTAALFAFVAAGAGFAQEEEMTLEEYEAKMNDLQAKKQTLTEQIETLNADIASLKEQKANMATAEDCYNSLYAELGATKADVDNFRKAVNELYNKIRAQEGPKEDRIADLEALQANKLSALPEFYDKVHNQMPKMIDAWGPAEADAQMHTVVRGDCLWNIAKQNQYYGNGFAWPKIYQANKDQIKDPDLIYPKQEFAVPPLTADEKAKYDKLRRGYKPAPSN